MKIYELQTKYVAIGVMESAPAFSDPRAVIEYMTGAFDQHIDQEQLWVILLNGSNKPMARVMCTLGLANQTQAHPRECYKHAIREGAVSIILVHNHPSGASKPSAEDVAMTAKMAEAGHILSIPLLDHIIIADESWTSIRSFRPKCFEC